MRRLAVVVAGDAFEPAGQLGEAGVQIDLRPITEYLRRAGDIREAIANISRAIPPSDLRLNVSASQDAAKAFGDFENAVCVPAAHIEHSVSRGIRLQRKQ